MLWVLSFLHILSMASPPPERFLRFRQALTHALRASGGVGQKGGPRRPHYDAPEPPARLPGGCRAKGGLPIHPVNLLYSSS